MPLYRLPGGLLKGPTGKLTSDVNCCICGEVPPDCGCDIPIDSVVTATFESACLGVNGITFRLFWTGTQWEGDMDSLACLAGSLSPTLVLSCNKAKGFGDWRDYDIIYDNDSAECPQTFSNLPDPDRGDCTQQELFADGIIGEASPGVCGCNCDSYPTDITIHITWEAPVLTPPETTSLKPGTAVAKLFREYGCDGRSYVHTMDNNGLQWCKNNIALIGSWIERTAKLKKKPFLAAETYRELVSILGKLE